MLSNSFLKNSLTNKIIDHLSISYLYRFLSILLSFLLVPISINFLNTDNYGIWLTISSFIGWFAFFDLGLGNGLRNKFGKARALNNTELAQGFISTAYYSISCVSFFLFLTFIIINFYINWAQIFNAPDSLISDLSILMPIIFGFFCFQLIAKLITSIYFAEQNHSFYLKIQFIIQLFTFLIIWILSLISKGSLLLYGTIYSALPFLVLIYFNITAFRGKLSDIKPKFSLVKRKYFNDIFGLGLKFFIIQFSALVLFSTDNFIISHVFSPAEVVPYNISYKYFSILIIVFSVLITPFWSSFTEAYEKKDFLWITKSIKSLQKIWLLVPIISLIMYLISNWFFKIWVGNDIFVPASISIGMVIYVSINTFGSIYSYFLNGIGVILLQLIISIIIVFVNIPLSIFLSKNVFNGPEGVIFATSICMFFPLFLWFLQVKKILNFSAKGIWIK